MLGVYCELLNLTGCVEELYELVHLSMLEQLS